MKISKSKQELARIISENGGWRDGSEFSAIEMNNGDVRFCKEKPQYEVGIGIFSFKDFAGIIEGKFTFPNWHQCILSREEYFHLYPAQDADGWIEWDATAKSCGPVDCDVLVDVKLKCGSEHLGQILSGDSWMDLWGDETIIAYRLHKPEQQLDGLCDKVTEENKHEHVDAKPTIEQLAADYRNRKDYADRKQEEADAAKADAEAKLAELVAAGKALNLVISVADKEPELVITDWRDLKVDDVISVQCFEKVYSKSTVLAVGVSDVLIRNHVGARKTVNLDDRDWSFILRP